MKEAPGLCEIWCNGTLFRAKEISQKKNIESISFCWQNLHKSCLVYLSWEATSILRPPWEVVFLKRFHYSYYFFQLCPDFQRKILTWVYIFISEMHAGITLFIVVKLIWFYCWLVLCWMYISWRTINCEKLNIGAVACEWLSFTVWLGHQ